MDSTQAQLQIRHNALEAQEYVQDLMDWQKSMKAKASSSSGSKVQQDHDVPVRGRASGDVQPAPHDMMRPAQLQPGKAAARSSKVPPAAHTYKNYSKWDKFDVDAAMQEADVSTEAKTAVSNGQAAPVRSPSSAQQQQKQEQQHPMMEPRQPNAPVPVPGSSSSSASNPKAASSDPAAAAASLKDRGNKLFQAGYFDEAISCYSQSIATHPTSLAYANRAMARLKLGRYADAEADCTAALQLDPTYIKALHRRGTALKHLGKLLDAAADFESVLRLEPGNTSVQADRDAVLKQYLEQQQIPPSSTWHNIQVTEQQQQQLEKQQQQQQQQQQQKPQQHATQADASKPAAVEAKSPSAAAAAAASNGSPSSCPPSAAAAGGGGGSTSTRSSSSSSSPVPQVSPRQQAAIAAAAQAAASQLAARLAVSFKAPKTGHDFETTWRSLKGDIDLQAKYLSLVSPSQLPTLFKSSLTAQLVSALLTASLTAITRNTSSTLPPPTPPPAAAAAAAAASGPAASNEPVAVSEGASGSGNGSGSSSLDAGHAVGLISGLVAVPRFDMMVMCLTSKDKAALRQLWEGAAAALDAGLKEQLGAVRPKYRL